LSVCFLDQKRVRNLRWEKDHSVKVSDGLIKCQIVKKTHREGQNIGTKGTPHQKPSVYHETIRMCRSIKPENNRIVTDVGCLTNFKKDSPAIIHKQGAQISVQKRLFFVSFVEQ
jgi:hypothetical protein